MSENLLRHGDIDKPLVLYNRTQEKAEAHSSKLGHCQVARTIPAAVSASDIIWICLENQRAVEETFEQILSTNVHGKLFVDSSTTNAETADMIAQRVTDAQAHFVAAPGISCRIKLPVQPRMLTCIVMGGPPLAISRSLTCIASGPRECVDRIRPYLEEV
jgi:3-hydroxyisobutyrate dehydrogenase-like beta-hydroxyacid dehydrogenase